MGSTASEHASVGIDLFLRSRDSCALSRGPTCYLTSLVRGWGQRDRDRRMKMLTNYTPGRLPVFLDISALENKILTESNP